MTESTGKTTKRTKTETTPDFDVFWAMYPKKTGKANAVKVWDRIAPDSVLAAEICSAVETQKTWRQWREGFIPDPERWLKGQRWLDEQPPENGGTRNGLHPARGPSNADQTKAAADRVFAQRISGRGGPVIETESRVLE